MSWKDVKIPFLEKTLVSFTSSYAYNCRLSVLKNRKQYGYNNINIVTIYNLFSSEFVFNLSLKFYTFVKICQSLSFGFFGWPHDLV